MAKIEKNKYKNILIELGSDYIMLILEYSQSVNSSIDTEINFVQKQSEEIKLKLLINLQLFTICPESNDQSH